ncbi:MAG TPA: Gfo/Idh/MocA family oxidoreductase [Gemmatimonadaceae bacterium]|nr:Gfo/Idh/MocA family oxidoreductase [Gemmatimonadaceae bacterium]
MASTSRRDFVRMTALSVAGAPLIPSIAHRATPTTVRQEKKLGYALDGLGSLSTNQIAPALQKTKLCRLAGIVTGTPAKAEQWKAKYGIPDRSIYNYDTIGRLADNPDVDVVYIVTPNSLHARDTIKAARAGKHVLCEKPMEVTTERCRQMIAACKAANRQLAIGYRCRFEPHHLEMLRIAKEKELGEVRLIESGFGFSIGDPTQWRLKHALAGGGPLMDVGVYSIQSAEMIAGQYPIAVAAMTTKTDPVKFKEVEESMTYELKFANGISASCTTTYKVNGFNRTTAYADRGSFGLAPAFNYGGIRGWRSDRKELAAAEIDQFATEMDDFADCIINNRPTTVPGEMGMRDVQTMMALYESARTGRVVRLG